MVLIFQSENTDYQLRSNECIFERVFIEKKLENELNFIFNKHPEHYTYRYTIEQTVEINYISSQSMMKIILKLLIYGEILLTQ